MSNLSYSLFAAKKGGFGNELTVHIRPENSQAASTFNLTKTEDDISSEYQRAGTSTVGKSLNGWIMLSDSYRLFCASVEQGQIVPVKIYQYEDDVERERTVTKSLWA
jgi:hypothetical protein